MKKIKLLLVDDEENFRKIMEKELKFLDYDITCAASSLQAKEKLTKENFEVILLDIEMPGMDGLKFLKNLKEENNLAEIIILTGHSSVSSAVQAIKLGAYDYLTKPFVLDEFLLRVNRLIEKSRWYRGTEGEVVIFGNDNENVVDFSARTAKHRDQKFDLTEQELAIFKFFFENQSRAIPRAEIQEEVLGFGEDVTSRTLDNFMVRLRRYFEDDAKNPQYFESVRGVGYRFHLKTR